MAQSIINSTTIHKTNDESLIQTIRDLAEALCQRATIRVTNALSRQGTDDETWAAVATSNVKERETYIAILKLLEE